MKSNKNIIFWGAGATAALGMRITAKQGAAIRSLVGEGKSEESLRKRVEEALGDDVAKESHDALYDLIMLLGDGAESYRSISSINEEQVEAMRRNWRDGASDEELKA